MSETPMISRRKLDEILPQLVATCYGDDVHRADGTELTHKEKEEFADAVANRIAHELAKAAEYDEAMRRLAMHQPNCAGTLPRSHAECDLCRFFKREIAANRFAP